MPIQELLLKLLLTVIVGGAIGAEREYRSKSAGFRTIIFICLGSFLFTLFSIVITKDSPDRIASNIVTGIGFIGAGVIFRSQSGLSGITTAAIIWVTAALGMGIACGYYTAVGIAAGITLLSQIVFNKLELSIDKVNQVHNYRIVSPYQDDLLERYEQFFKEHKLRFKRIKQTKSGKNITGSWHVQGSEKNHQLFIERILHDTTVLEFEF